MKLPLTESRNGRRDGIPQPLLISGGSRILMRTAFRSATFMLSAKLSLTSRSTRRAISSFGSMIRTAPGGMDARRLFPKAGLRTRRSCKRSGVRKPRRYLPRSRRRLNPRRKSHLPPLQRVLRLLLSVLSGSRRMILSRGRVFRRPLMVHSRFTVRSWASRTRAKSTMKSGLTFTIKPQTGKTPISFLRRMCRHSSGR